MHLKISPLNTDHQLKKHNLTFGIVPNQRHLDKTAYRDMISKQYLTKNQRKTLLKLETFLKSDKITHHELFRFQQLQRMRANLELDDTKYRKEIEQVSPQVQIPSSKEHD